MATELDERQARANLAQTEALIPPLEAGRRQAANQLCVLLGMPVTDLTGFFSARQNAVAGNALNLILEALYMPTPQVPIGFGASTAAEVIAGRLPSCNVQLRSAGQGQPQAEAVLPARHLTRVPPCPRPPYLPT